MSESTIAPRLSRRVLRLPKPAEVLFDGNTPSRALCEYLDTHLTAGETHYTTRPGMVELRRMVDDRLCSVGVPPRSEAGVVITASEGEAMYVTLMGLGMTAGVAVVAARPDRHLHLFQLMNIDVTPTAVVQTSHNVLYLDCSYSDSAVTVTNGDSQNIVSVGSRLTDADLMLRLDPASIVIGDLHGLPGLGIFGVGFVSAPPELAKRIMSWKQALSICSAAPSQRAALFQMEARSNG